MTVASHHEVCGICHTVVCEHTVAWLKKVIESKTPAGDTSTHCKRCKREHGSFERWEGDYCMVRAQAGDESAYIARAACTERYVRILETQARDLEAQVKTVINTDRTGLAAGINRVREVLKGYSWIAEGHWGSYSDEQQTEATLRKEVGFLIQAAEREALTALVESGKRADAAATFKLESFEVDESFITVGSIWKFAAGGGTRRVKLVDPLTTETCGDFPDVVGEWGDRKGEFLARHTYVSDGKDIP